MSEHSHSLVDANYLLELIYRIYDCPDVMSTIASEDMGLANDVADLAEARGT